MSARGHEKRAGAMASPSDPNMIGDGSELEHIGDVEHPGVDLDLADIGATHLDIGLDVDIAHIGAQGRTLVDRVIETGMEREAPAVIQIDIDARERALAAPMKGVTLLAFTK